VLYRLMVAYLHHVPGRLRLKIASLKGDPDAAAAAQRDLSAVPGIITATANPVTGSLTIHYCEREIDADRLWGILRHLGLVDDNALQSFSDRRHPADPLFAALAPRVLKVLATTTLEWAVSQSAARLVAALL
jgi:hypothetical protein